MQEHADDCINYSERRLEMDNQWRHHAARASAAEDIASIWKTEAGELFSEGNDEAAKNERQHANWLESWAKNERELQERAQTEYDREYPA